MEVMFTIVGINHYFDSDDLRANQEIILRKELDNKIDEEAIVVYTNDLNKVGYIANSVNTRAKGTYSAGRLYDKIDNEVVARALVIFHNTAIGVIHINDEKDL